MVKKSIKVHLQENESYSSAAKGFFESRLVVWSMVEAIQESMGVEDEREVASEQPPSEWNEELPMSFGSNQEKMNHTGLDINIKKRNRKNKRKRKLDSTITVTNSLWKLYKKFTQTTRRIQEENFFYVPSSLWPSQLATETNTEEQLEHASYYLVQVRGIAPHLIPDIENPTNTEEILLIRFLHSFQYLYVPRSYLIPISSSANSASSLTSLYHINTVYQQIDEDFWFKLKAYKPAYLHEKYWDQRYRIFNRYDEGIMLDEESWYSITYENVANHITDRCLDIIKQHNLGTITNVIDAFSGCGGMTIPIAQRGLCVTAVDIDEEKLKYLQVNAKVYQVSERIEYVRDNVWTFLRSLSNYPLFLRYIATLEKLDNKGRAPEQYDRIAVEDLFRYKSYEISSHGLPELNNSDYDIIPPEQISAIPEEDRDSIPLQAEEDESPMKRRRHIRFADEVIESEEKVAKEEEEEQEKEREEIEESENTSPSEQIENENAVGTNDTESCQKDENSSLQSLLIAVEESEVTSNQGKVSYQLHQSLYDLIILSPPWNGPGYLAHDEYDLRTMLSSGDGYCLACLAASVSHFFVMVLPRNTPNEAITQICNIIHFQVIIETVYLHRKCKVKVCYFYYRRNS